MENTKVKVKGRVLDQVRALYLLSDQVRDQVWRRVRNQVRNQMDEVWSQVWGQLKEEL